MTRYSSEQFIKDWRYKLEQDIYTSTGINYPYADDGFKTWDDESSYRKIHYDQVPTPEDIPRLTCASVSSDGKLLAVGAGQRIDVYETETFANLYHLIGHSSTVEAVEFQPGNSDLIVSASTQNFGGAEKADCEVIFWRLDESWTKNMRNVDSLSPKIAAKATRSMVQELSGFGDNGINLNEVEVASLQSSVAKALTKAITHHTVPPPLRMNARLLVDNFQSKCFSPSGTKLIYLPGNRPKSNQSDPWNLGVLSVTTDHSITPPQLVFKPLYDLIGHTDAVMWASFSPDESLIGTVAWDKTMRIWDGHNGALKYTFHTNGQNWAGDFSPDSKFFAGTCGDGNLFVYSLTDGSTLLSHDFHAGWCRRIAWHPDPSKRVIAVSGGKLGKLFLFDIENKEVVQERKLSVDATNVDEKIKRILPSYLSVSHLAYVDDGKMLVTLTSGDGGIEVYHFQNQNKYRFARPNTVPEDDRRTMDGRSGTSVDSMNRVNPLVQGGFNMVTWENKQTGKVMMASLDGDSVRIWSVPIHSKADETKPVKSWWSTWVRS